MQLPSIYRWLARMGSQWPVQPSLSRFLTDTKEKEDTDDKGILTFDFSKSGTYTLSDPAGNVIKTVSIAGSGMSTTAMIITGAAADRRNRFACG